MIERSRKEREERKNEEIKSNNSTQGSHPEGSNGSQVWSSSTDGEGDAPECSNPNSIDIILTEDEIKRINYQDVE